ncbi:hypothetical protein IQ07DRAFT_635076 [Pyrenochaeta sp. DS3sAY3a]|nr:hypothetical protein IQ07DRAFT_635076 [Pyrenochaeta sp. DS3sAY3a]
MPPRLSYPASPDSPILFPDYDFAFTPPPAARKTQAQAPSHAFQNSHASTQKPTQADAHSTAAPVLTSPLHKRGPAKKKKTKKPEDERDEYFPPVESGLMLMEVHRAWKSTMDYGFGVVGFTPPVTTKTMADLALYKRAHDVAADMVDGRPLSLQVSVSNGDMQLGNADGAPHTANQPLRFRTAAYRRTVGAAVLKLQSARMDSAAAVLGAEESSVEDGEEGKGREEQGSRQEGRGGQGSRDARKEYSRLMARNTVAWVNSHAGRQFKSATTTLTTAQKAVGGVHQVNGNKINTKRHCSLCSSFHISNDMIRVTEY